MAIKDSWVIISNWAKYRVSALQKHLNIDKKSKSNNNIKLSVINCLAFLNRMSSGLDMSTCPHSSLARLTSAIFHRQEILN